ncbi:MAG TPA: hypothetical protein VEC57_15065 [Candidatus Limnocylindrales bacterium]|nr:hypothetical protein [Candidatus Limnocylindrales bacterium]
MWQSVGDTIARTIGGWQQSRDMERQRAIEDRRRGQEDEARELQLRTGRAQAAAVEQEQRGQAFERSMLPLALKRGEDGVTRFDRDLLTQEFTNAGLADRLPDVFQRLDEQDNAALAVLNARRDAVASVFYGVLQGGNRPESFAAALEYARANDLAPARELDVLDRMASQDPASIAELTRAVVGSSPKFASLIKPKEPVKLGPNELLVDPQTRETIAQGIRPPEKRNLQRETAMVGGRPTFVNFDPQSGEYFDLQGNPIAELSPVPPQRPDPGPSFQAKEVLNDEGVPVMANFDARTGRYVGPDGEPITNPRPVPSALETQDARKFQQAGPILNALSELSERINTQQGLLAKMAGGAAKLAAQANYDDDVAEYTALIESFTPLVARAYGHTGVLTQQDVDSVKAMFPKPGDSKSLRDRKIKRVLEITNSLQNLSSTSTQAAVPDRPAGGTATPREGEQGVIDGKPVEWRTINGQSGWVPKGWKP